MLWSKNVCRICGDISDALHYIYNKESASGLEEKIKKCFHLELYKDDYKPKQVCYRCVDKLSDFSNFIDICYATNHKFEVLYYNSPEWHHRNTYNDPSTQHNNHQSVIVSNKHGIENVDVDFYKGNNTSLESFNVVSLSANDVLGYVPTSENCNIQYFNEQNSNKPIHLAYQATVLRHSPNEDVIESESELLNMVSYRHHQKDSLVMCEFPEPVTTNVYNPPIAEEINEFCSNVTLNENILVSKESSNLISVEDVKKLIATQPLDAGLNVDKKAKNCYPCSHCERSFLRRGTLNAHVSIHTHIKPYNCGQCSKSFAVKSILTTHEKTHIGNHKCKICLKMFSVPSKLERHLRIHMNDKPFICNYDNCGKAFSDKRNLDGHKSIHMTERNFSCDICKKAFKTSNKLHQHKKCHISSLRYKCDVCLKQYKHRTNLIRHLKKHHK